MLFRMQVAVAGVILVGILVNFVKAQVFVLYGSVDIGMEHQHTPANCFWQHQLSVDIGNNNWQQPLKWRFYAFKVPQSLMSERTGVLSLNAYRHEEFVKSLWTEYFVIHHLGGALRLDIRNPPSHPCKGEDAEAEAEAVGESYAVVPLVLGDTVRYSYSYSYSGCYSFSYLRSKCQGKGRGEGNNIIIPRSMMMLPESATTIQGKKHVWLQWLIIVFAVAQLVIRWLQSCICKGKSQMMTMMMEWRRGGEEGRKRWEMSTYSTAINENENGNSTSNTTKGVLVSGEGTYEEAWAWADAGHQLTKLKSNCCFYYNSTTTTSHNNSNTKKGGTATAAALEGEGKGEAAAALEGEGPWNRDAFGRLIRLPPSIVQQSLHNKFT